MIIKKIMITLAAMLALLIMALGAASQYFLHYALSRSNDRYSMDDVIPIKTDYPWTAHWIDSVMHINAVRDTFITNADGLRLHAWYMPATVPTQRTAVIVHGYTSHPIDMMPIGYLFHHSLGWNILMPDLVAHGQSEGEWIQMGWRDRKDVEQWIGVAHDIFESDTMIVHGISMGAATTMCVAGDDTPEYVRAFIEDCGYTSVWDEFEGEMERQFHLPAFPLLHVTSRMSDIQLGWNFREASPLAQVARCRKPMLFIHGSEDNYVPTSMMRPLYDAHPLKAKEFWLAPGSAHARSYQDHHEVYTIRVRDFLQKYI